MPMPASLSGQVVTVMAAGLMVQGGSGDAARLQLLSARPNQVLESRAESVVVEGLNFSPQTSVVPVSGGGHFVSEFDTGGAWDVAVADGYAYVVGGTLQILDVHDVQSPRLIATLPLGGLPGSVTLSGEHVFIGVRNGLRVVNVADPTTPIAVGSLTLTCDGKDIAVLDSIAVLACGHRGGIAVIDVSQPERPNLTARVTTFGAQFSFFNEAVALRGTTAFVTDSEMTLVAVDLSDPARPELISTAQGSYFRGFKITLDGEHAYVSTGDHLLVFDISTPTVLPVVGRTQSRTLYGVAAAHGFVYATNSGGWPVEVYDVRDPNRPIRLYGIPSPGTGFAFGQNLYLSDGYVYLPDTRTGSLLIYDVRLTDLPGSVGQLDLPTARDVRLAGHLAYVAGGHEGFHVVDISDPAQPRLVGSAGDADSDDVAVDGSLAYLSDFSSGLRIVDIADPGNPTPLGRLALPDYSGPLAVKNGFAYVVGYYQRQVDVIDATDPRTPGVVATIPTASDDGELAIAGDLLYVANGIEGIMILDISTPAAPREVGRLGLPGEAVGIAVEASRAAVAAGDGGFHLLDVSRPDAPSLLGSLEAGNFACWKVDLADDFAYVTGRVGGRHDFYGTLLIDLHLPSAPRLAAGLSHRIGPFEITEGIGVMVDGFGNAGGALRTFRLPAAPASGSRLDDSTYRLDLPARMSPGFHHLVGLELDVQQDFLHNAIEVLEDADADGVPPPSDCDDAAADVHPGAPDLPGNAIDEDCDGSPTCDPAGSWARHGQFTTCVVAACKALVAAGQVNTGDCAKLLKAESARPE